MQRIIYTFIFMLISLAGGNAWAQSPDAFQYQAVIRNAEGNIRANEDVTLTIAILEGSTNGTIVYEESHDVTTNAMGLVDLMIGRGSTGDDFTAINWGGGAWFIKVTINGNVMGTSQLLSVPFAKYADKSGDAFSGDFSDLTGTPQYLDTDSTDDFSGDYGDLSNPPDLETKLDSSATSGWDKDTTDDFSGNYNDLENRPKYISDIKLVADGRPIRQVGEPKNPDDAATKAYVDTSLIGGWSLSGNDNIDPSSQFLGTTDGQPLVFRVNNTERMRLDTSGSLTLPNNGNSLFIGAGAGSQHNLTNGRNVFIGDSSGVHNVSGEDNTAIGYRALYRTNSSLNTAIGTFSQSNTSGGIGNTSLGFYSLQSNTAGNSNTALGHAALTKNTTGSKNIAIGTSSLSNNETGDNNLAVGLASLYYNTTGSNNTAFGYRSAQSNTSGHSNVAMGVRALFHNENGSKLVAIGDSALYHNNYNTSYPGRGNVAVGSKALFNNTGGDQNVAVGREGLYSNTTGNYNVALGQHALHANTEGSLNTANGDNALDENTTGNRNTAYGGGSLGSNTTGNYNSGIGVFSLFYNESGNYNTALGYDAGPAYSNPGLSNTMALGSQAFVSASNTVRIGNSSITQIGGAVGWSNLSDGRFKTDVTPNVPGLDFIMRLEPVTFHWDLAALDQFQGKDQSNEPLPKAMKEARRKKQEKTFTGFVAQQVEEAAEEIGYEFSGIRKPANENSTYNLSYAEFVVPLVKAVQQQQKTIENQQKMIDALIDEINQLK